MIWSHCIIKARIADNCDIILLSVFGSYPHACMSLLLHGMFVVLPLFIVFVSVLNVSYPLLCNYSIYLFARYKFVLTVTAPSKGTLGWC